MYLYNNHTKTNMDNSLNTQHFPYITNISADDVGVKLKKYILQKI